ncbi:uncharacterized protein LOC142346190 [Convolutriloba macropyga]|uniref:uncharacterized protein LOC142346190 n=1 Tax=Convolutriloba macropyga TaxID=536237 RepID=UPI003F52199D
MAQKQIIADLTNICVLTFWILSCTDIWSGSANSATDNDWTLDQHAFKVTTPGFTDYKVKIGDQIDFEFEMTAKQNITDDILIVEMSASYNGFSSFLFCGKPVMRTTNDFMQRNYNMWGSTYDSTYDGKLFDSYIFDFGTVNALENEVIKFNWRMLVADNAKYEVGKTYWMGVGVEFAKSSSIWVNDIAFELDAKPTPTGDPNLSFDFSSSKPTYIPGGSQSSYLTVIDPFNSVGFRLQVALQDTKTDDMCICSFRPFSIDNAFVGCGSEGFPPHTIKFWPSFNDTKCKKEYEIDFGVLSKVDISSSDAYDGVTMEIIMCASESASGQYIMDARVNVSAGPQGKNLDEEISFEASEIAELDSISCSIDILANSVSASRDFSVRATVQPSPFDTSTNYVIRQTLKVTDCPNDIAAAGAIVDVEPRMISCSIDILANSVSASRDFSVRATVQPSPFDTSTNYVIRQTLKVTDCPNDIAAAGAIVDVEPRMVLKSRYVAFQNEINFWNDSAISFVSEYDPVMVTRKHIKYFTEQENFDFIVDFRATFGENILEKCPNIALVSDVFLVQHGTIEFRQCEAKFILKEIHDQKKECPFPSVEIVGMMDQDNPTVAMNAGSASAVHFAVTMSQECEATVLEQFTGENVN